MKTFLAVGLLLFAISLSLACTAYASTGEPVSASDMSSRSAVLILNWNARTNRVYLECTGVVISKDIIVTAAHCIREGKYHTQPMDRRMGKLIFFGSRLDISDLSALMTAPYSFQGESKLRWATIDSVKVHPEYKGQTGDVVDPTKRVSDIAILRMNRPIPPEANIAKLSQSPPISGLSDDKEIFGYGPTLQERNAKIAVLSKLSGNSTDFFEQFGVAKMVFASGEILGGDSGGPIFVNSTGEAWAILRGGVGPVAMVTPLQPYYGWLRNSARLLGGDSNF